MTVLPVIESEAPTIVAESTVSVPRVILLSSVDVYYVGKVMVVVASFNT